MYDYSYSVVSVSPPTPSRYSQILDSQQNSEFRGCFSEHSTLSVSLELKSKPSTVDCTLWPTTISTVASEFAEDRKPKQDTPGPSLPLAEVIS